MKSALSVCVVAILAGLPAHAKAQQFASYPKGQCDASPKAKPAMVACIDWVVPQVIAGWALDLNVGRQPIAIQLWHVTKSNHLVYVPTTQVTVARPDVDAAFGVTNPNLGFGLIAVEPLEPGMYFVEITDIPYSATCGWDKYNGMWCGYAANQLAFVVN